MSDSSQGDGWWQASDGKWYAPEAVEGAPPPPPQQAPPPPPQQSAPPPQGAPPPPQHVYVQAQPQKSSSGCLKWALIIGGIIAVLGLILIIATVAAVDDAVDEIDDIQQQQDSEIADDVTGVECVTSDAGFMAANIDVTNNSSDPSTYLIEVVFEDPASGDQLDTAIISTDNLNNGQSTTLEALTLTEAPAGGFTCDVVDVTRLAS